MKFSGSWKTVMFSVFEVAGGAFSLEESTAASPFKPEGGGVGMATSAIFYGTVESIDKTVR